MASQQKKFPHEGLEGAMWSESKSAFCLIVAIRSIIPYGIRMVSSGEF